MTYLRKNTLKNHENVRCLDFQFHDLKFSQERYFGPFLILQPLTYLWKKYLKANFVEQFERKLWKQLKH